MEDDNLIVQTQGGTKLSNQSGERNNYPGKVARPHDEKHVQSSKIYLQVNANFASFC